MLNNWLKITKNFLKSSKNKLGAFLFEQEDNIPVIKKINKIKKNKENIKDNFGDFVNEQKREVKELITGQQNLTKYFHDASYLFKDYFIPNDDNDNRPKILRPKQLTIIAILLLIVKLSLVGYLFSVYQRTAEMSETTINQLLILTNESRVANGAKALTLNPVLNQAAQMKAEDMIINNYFSHTSPDGRKPWNFVNRSAYPYLLVGENLGMNFIAANDVHAALMASPSHQKNILNPKYTDLGLAVINGELDGKKTNILVEIFAYKSEPTETIAIIPSTPEADTYEAVVVDSAILTVENTPEAILEITPLVVEEIQKPVPETEIIVASETETKVDVLAQNQAVIMPVLSTMRIDNEGINNSQTNVSLNNPIDNPEVINNQGTLDFEQINSDLENLNNLLETDAGRENNTNNDPVIPEVIPTTSEELLSEEELPIEPVLIATTSDVQVSRAALILNISRWLYVFFLLFLIVSLLINIFVRFTIQHKSVILQTALLIILVLALIFFDFGFITELRNAATNIVLF